MSATVHQFACLDDNYGFLVRDDDTGKVAAIDTPDADAILRELDGLGWRLTLILNTHWHPDHAGGNEALIAATGAKAVGPAEVRRIAPLDREVTHGDTVLLGATRFEVLGSGGHTLGHIVYHAPAENLLFAGDTLFPMGCGRLFEGTPEQMWESLSRLAALPPETTVYSAHEYALANARFAVSVDPSQAVSSRAAAVAAAREDGRWTVPSTLAEEVTTNPFLRAPLLPVAAGLSPVEAFAKVRAAKDSFRG